MSEGIRSPEKVYALHSQQRAYAIREVVMGLRELKGDVVTSEPASGSNKVDDAYWYHSSSIFSALLICKTATSAF